METVNTVCGPISADALGLTSMHEHFIVGIPGWEHVSSKVYDQAEAFERIKTSLAEFKNSGGRTVVDMSGIVLGRNVEMFKRLSEVTGVNIVVSTGFGEERYVPGHFYHDRSRDTAYLKRVLGDEVHKGTVAAQMKVTSIKAGIVKVGASAGGVTSTERIIALGAVGMSKEAGKGSPPVALMARSTGSLSQLADLCLSEGMRPQQVIVEVDQYSDPWYDTALGYLGKGCYVTLNKIGIGMIDAGIETAQVQWIGKMIDRGYEDRVMLGCDSIVYGIEQAKTAWTFAYLCNNFRRKLKEAGLKDTIIDKLLCHNPKNALLQAVA